MLSYEVITPEGGVDPLNALLQVANTQNEALLTLRSEDGESFTLGVSDVVVRYDQTGLFLADARAALGRVSCCITKPQAPAGEPAGQVTIASEGEVDEP